MSMDDRGVVKHELGEDHGKDTSFINMDASTMQEVLQAINGQCALTASAVKDRVIKRQRRGNRMKVYDNGYIFTYDKDSQCGQRSFWRCERKSECQARVHTNPATNQIIKRINEHTHEAPSREDLPPWLVLSQTTSDTSDDGNSSNGRESTTGILLNANYTTTSCSSANTQLSHMVERELDYSEPHQIEQIEVKVNPEVNLVKDEPIEEELITPPSKKRKRCLKKEELPGAMELMNTNSEQFWEVYEHTKKLIKFFKDGGTRMSMSPEPPSAPCNGAVAEWLESHNLGEYKSRFSKYNMDSLKSLSSADCVAICRSDADGLLLFHSLRSSDASSSTTPNPSFSSTPSPLTLFIAERPDDGSDDPLYQMISLVNKTPADLHSQMEQRGLLSRDQATRFCVVGPKGIKVELNEEILSSWAAESVFQFFIQRGVCHLDRIS